jgi:hypothetical protein
MKLIPLNGQYISRLSVPSQLSGGLDSLWLIASDGDGRESLWTYRRLVNDGYTVTVLRDGSVTIVKGAFSRTVL